MYNRNGRDRLAKKAEEYIMVGIFGGLFDFNGDGKMDVFERAAESAFLDEITKDDQRTEFEMSGLDADELEFMDAEERREALEGAGLEPDDYDF